MLKEFRAFIMRGNVFELAVAVIIGAAFTKIISSLTDDILMPIIARITGGLDFASHFVVMGPVPKALIGSTDYAALKKAGVPLLGYGQFITQVINFLIVAFLIFMIIRLATRLMPKHDAVVANPAEIVLLTEIRDALRVR